jgi:steroid delta-isomerase-like uncharacterized protein
MEQVKKNKEFIIRYYNALSGGTKTREMLTEYITDPELIEHIIFFDRVFPKYEMVIEEMTAEGNRVVVRATMKGVHEGDFNGIPPTHRKIESPGVVSYQIENGKIVHYWLFADQALVMEQLGIMNVPAGS